MFYNMKWRISGLKLAYEKNTRDIWSLDLIVDSEAWGFSDIGRREFDLGGLNN